MYIISTKTISFREGDICGTDSMNHSPNSSQGTPSFTLFRNENINLVIKFGTCRGLPLVTTLYIIIGSIIYSGKPSKLFG